MKKPTIVESGCLVVLVVAVCVLSLIPSFAAAVSFVSPPKWGATTGSIVGNGLRDYCKVTSCGIREAADSVALVVTAEKLKEVTVGGITSTKAKALDTKQAKDELCDATNQCLCGTDKFSKQQAIDLNGSLTDISCTGVLVAKDLVATAGHCLDNVPDPTQLRFVFGYRLGGTKRLSENYFGTISHIYSG